MARSAMLPEVAAVEVPLGPGITVRRLLPRAARRMVGPRCFLDIFGEVRRYAGPRLPAPRIVARPVPPNPAS